MAGQTHQETRSLFRRWCQKPTDEAPGRVYADALMEQGDALGEVITYAWRGGDRLSVPKTVFAPVRHNRWLDMTQETLSAIVPQVADVSLAGDATFSLMLPAEAWLRHHKRLRSSAPISELCLTQLEPEHMRRLGKAGILGPLRSVSFVLGSRSHGKAASLNALLSSPDLGAVNKLDLPVSTPDMVDLIVAQRHFTQLRSLSLSTPPGGIGMGDRGARLLSLAPHLPRVQSLSLDGQRIGAEGFEALSHARWPLQHLAVRRFTDEPWLQWLSRPPWDQRLTSLDISTSALAFAKELLPGTIDWPFLRELGLREPVPVTIPGPHYDAVLSDWLERLRAPALQRLHLHTQHAGAGLAAALTRQAFCSQLKALELIVRLNDEVLSALAFGPWDKLRSLAIGHGGLSEVGARALSASALPKLLEVLALGAHIDSEASEALAKTNWPSLHTLHLNGAVGTLLGTRAFLALERLSGHEQHDLAQAYVASPHAALTELELQAPERDELLRLAAAPHASRLRTLSIIGAQQLDDFVAQALADSPSLKLSTLLIRQAHNLTVVGKQRLVQKFGRALVLEG